MKPQAGRDLKWGGAGCVRPAQTTTITMINQVIPPQPPQISSLSILNPGLAKRDDSLQSLGNQKLSILKHLQHHGSHCAQLACT